MSEDDHLCRGSITNEFTFWCGLCQNWERESASANRRDASAVMKRAGWRYTHKNGWVCPRHGEKKP